MGGKKGWRKFTDFGDLNALDEAEWDKVSAFKKIWKKGGGLIIGFLALSSAGL